MPSGRFCAGALPAGAGLATVLSAKHAATVQIHDQGAGGNCNVVKEIIYPAGAEIDVRAVRVGDATLSVLEIWGAEYQENDCVLVRPRARGTLERLCARERTYMQVRALYTLRHNRAHAPLHAAPLKDSHRRASAGKCFKLLCMLRCR